MPIEQLPVHKTPKNYVPPHSVQYKVKDGDSWVSLAQANGIDPWDLIEANFKTRSAPEVNWYLHHYVGCNVPTKDGKNWTFSSSASPGLIYIPIMPPLYYVVPNMKLIPQDKTMSCWFASGQMLIQWRSQMTRTSEASHPDPSLLTKWSKLYDNNPGISNAQIANFANDLGLSMVGPVTPSPSYVQDLLRQNGPLWVNGNFAHHGYSRHPNRRCRNRGAGVRPSQAQQPARDLAGLLSTVRADKQHQLGRKCPVADIDALYRKYLTNACSPLQSKAV